MKAYHYTESGLNNIYLVNGVKTTKAKDGSEEIFIHDIHGLHKAIGMSLISKRGLLSKEEIKFIRTTLDLSQKALAKLLGLSYQTILMWEKDKAEITKTADHLLRAIFFSYLNTEKNKTVYNIINEISDLDAEEVKSQNKLEFKEVGDEWRMVA